MAAGLLAISSFTPARDRQGRLVAGARMDVFQNRTTTRATVYADAGLTTPLTNPVIANSSGQFPAVWAQAGTTATPILYTVAYSGPASQSIGNPSTFDDIQPSVSLDLVSGETKLDRDGSDATSNILDNLPYSVGGTGAVPYGWAAKARREMRSVIDFGADPNKSVDSTNAFRNALATGAAVFVPPGDYLISGTIPRPLGSSLFGDKKFRAGLYPQAGNYPLFRIDGSFTDTSNLVIDNISKTGGVDVSMRIAGDVVETHITDVITDRSFGWFSEDFVSGKHFRTYFNGIKNLRHRGPGYVFTKAFAFIYIDDKCVVDFPGSLNPNFVALQATGGTLGVAEGGFFCGLQVGGTFGTAGTTSAQKAFVFTNMGEVHMQGARADTCGEGMLFDGCTNLYMEGVASKLNDSHQMTIKDCIYVIGTGIRLNGRNQGGLTASAARDGLRFEGSTGVVNLAALQSIENTGHGIQHIAGNEILITGFQSRTNTLRGVKTGTGGVVKLVGGGLNANTAGNYDLGGSLHSIKDTYNAAGAEINQLGVGTG